MSPLAVLNPTMMALGAGIAALIAGLMLVLAGKAARPRRGPGDRQTLDLDRQTSIRHGWA